jgi:drug/metabolite transporter (DMT)-like permease
LRLDWYSILVMVITAIAIALCVLAAQPIFRRENFKTGARKVLTYGLTTMLGAVSLVGAVILLRYFTSDLMGFQIYSYVAIFLVGIAGLALIVTVLSLSGLIADVAKSKGRSWAAFFWMSSLISPLIIWIIVSAMSPAPAVQPFGNQANFNDPVAAKLTELQALLDRGLISRSEFEQKRAELLSRI